MKNEKTKIESEDKFCNYLVRDFFFFFYRYLKTKLQTKSLTYQSLTENKYYKQDKQESKKVINPNLKLQCLSGNKGGNGEFPTPKEFKRLRSYQP